MSLYVIIEHDNKQIKLSSYSVLQAALLLSHEVIAVVAGYQCESVVEEVSTLTGVAKVLIADDKAYEYALAEGLTSLILSCVQNPTYLLVGATSFGKSLMPRIAACLGVSQVSEVIEIKDKNTFKRPIYAGNAIETVRSTDPIICLTIRPTAFIPVAKKDASAPLEKISFISDNLQSTFVSKEVHSSDRPELTSASLVISGGRGLKNKAGFSQMLAIADRLGAAVGASRAAVDSELAPNDWQVGQTGQVVAPELYIALGISGAIQHLAGMKGSKTIVAINKDPDAPIFQVADYGLVADLDEVLPRWEEVLTEMGY